MKKMFLAVLVSLLLCFAAQAQNDTKTDTKTTGATNQEQPKRQIFRANKDQIAQAQKMLKENGKYAGAEDGRFNDDFRAAIKEFQDANGLKKTGTLNRATLEKMNIELTDKQKEIPASESSYATSDDSKSNSADKPKRTIFRSTKEQIVMAQNKLREMKMYDGEASGKLDDATREGLKKFQQANDLKVTGTLNAVTLEKMGIELTDKQKENTP